MDYITGADIENVLELEDNYMFMLDVLKYSKDKKMYDFCSLNVKLNYEFVRGLISIFPTDYEFLDMAVSKYISNKLDFIDSIDSEFTNIDVIHSQELIVLMSNMFSNTDDINKYMLKSLAIFECVYTKLQIAIKQARESYTFSNLGYGFGIIEEDYKDSKVMIDFMAKNMLRRILITEDLSFKNLIYKYYQKCIKKQGVFRFICSYVSAYDTDLSDYMVCNSEIAKEYIDAGKKYVANWDNYQSSLNERRIPLFYQEIIKVISKYSSYKEFALNYIDVEMYIINKLGLNKIIPIDEDLEYTDLRRKKITNIERKCLNELCEYTRKLFSEGIIESKNDDYDDALVVPFTKKRIKNN